jgi:hypothetical protein
MAKKSKGKPRECISLKSSEGKSVKKNDQLLQLLDKASKILGQSYW